MFTATIAHSASEEKIRRCSSKECACYAGTTRRATHTEKLKQQQGIKPIESQIPSAKIVGLEKLDGHVQYMLRHVATLFKFYSIKSDPF